MRCDLRTHTMTTSTELPEHVWERVWERLESITEIVMASSVCKSWNLMLKNYVCNVKQLQRQAPKLLISNRNEDHQHQFYGSYDVTCNRMQNLELNIDYGMMRFCGSSKGWLAGMNDDYSLTLFKAYSNDGFSISLPPVCPWFRKDINEPYILDVIDLSDPEAEFPPEKFPHLLNPCSEEVVRRSHRCDYHIRRTLITADPISDPSRCFVVAMLRQTGYMAITRPWQDTAWTKIIPHSNKNKMCMFDMQYHEDKLYLVNQCGSVVALSLFDPTVLELVAPATPVMYLPGPGDTERDVSRYIVITEQGELFQILQPIDTVNTDLFIVYKWDSDHATWLEIQNLGNVSFFLGISCSMCVAAPHCLPNRIYFTQDIFLTTRDELSEIKDIGVYNLVTRKFEHHFGLDSQYLLKLNNQPPIWVLPTIHP